jgi:hypothetical protein
MGPSFFLLSTADTIWWAHCNVQGLLALNGFTWAHQPMHLLLPMASSGPIIFSVICPQCTGVGPLEYAPCKEASHRPVFFIYFFAHMSITYSPLFWCYVFVYSPCPDYYIV